MSKTLTPQIWSWTCDRCKATGTKDDSESPFFNGASQMRIHSEQRDLFGMNGGHTYEFDLCDQCSREFETWREQKPAKDKP